MVNCIDFANSILKNEIKFKGELRVYYILMKYKKKDSYDILTNISGHSNLAQLMDSLVNINNSISVVGYWIVDSN